MAIKHTKTAVPDVDKVDCTDWNANHTAEEDPVFTAWDKDHADLTGVTSDQHHNEAHTLASHSSKDHSELTNVTSDQHHAQSHNAASHSDITSTGAQIDDAVTKKHSQNTDTDLDATFEATFVKKVDNVNVLADITSAGANIEDAVTKRHTQNTDTALGAQTQNLDMNTHKIVGVVDPTANQEAATKKYVDDTAAPTPPAGNDGEVQFNDAGSFGADSNLFWDDTFKALGVGTSTLGYELDVVGNIRAAVGADRPESLNETDFTTHAKWDTTGDFDDTGGNAFYNHNTGNGSLTQIAANMAVPFVASRCYKFTYNVTALAHVGMMVAVVMDSPTGDYVYLDLSLGVHTTYFQASATPGDFYIMAMSDTVGDAFVLDDFSLVIPRDGSFIGSKIAVGHKAQATGDYSTALGYTTIASGASAFAMGTSAKATGLRSTAMGESMTASGTRSFGIGLDGSPYTLSQNDTMAIMGGQVGIGTVTPGSKLAVVGLPIYANNAAAITGGLAAGDFYRTNADPDPVCVVH